MLTNNAQKNTLITDGLDNARKPAATSITLRNKTVDVSKLEPKKKIQLIDFLTQSYNHNIHSIQQSSTSQESHHSSDYDTLIQLLTNELNSHDMSEGGKAKLIYLLHNRVEQQDKVLNKHGLKQHAVKPSAKPSAKQNTGTSVNQHANQNIKAGKIKSKKPIDIFSARNENSSVLMNDVATDSEIRHKANATLQNKGLTSELSLQSKNTLSHTEFPILKQQPPHMGQLKPTAFNSVDSELEEIGTTYAEEDEDDDEDEFDYEQQFELKDHFKTHSQNQWPTSSDELIIEVLHLNNGQVKNVTYLQKGQNFKVNVAGKTQVLAKNKGAGLSLIHI